MAVDNPVPLVSVERFSEGAFGDLIRSFSPQAKQDLMIEATRACETECQRRLAPFTSHVETHRAEGVDPDEYGDSASMPLDLPGALGQSQASSLGVNNLVRHCWLNEYAPLYSEFWAYSDVRISIVRSYGGQEDLPGTQYVGPELDSGHVWFNLGKFIPVGSLIRTTYSGGYVTVPADLVRAAKYMAAAIAVRELDPMASNHGHDAGTLEALAVSWLSPYARSS